jgi:hypothetical protein
MSTTADAADGAALQFRRFTATSATLRSDGTGESDLSNIPVATAMPSAAAAIAAVPAPTNVALPRRNLRRRTAGRSDKGIARCSISSE